MVACSSSPLHSTPLLPRVFSSSRPTDPFFFSHPFERPDTHDRYKRRERLWRCKGRKKKKKETEYRSTGEGLQTKEEEENARRKVTDGCKMG